MSSLSFLLFKGFQPEVGHPLYPLLDRVASKKIAYVSISSTALRTASVSLGKGFVQIDALETALIPQGMPSTKHELFDALPRKTNCGLVIVHIGAIGALDLAQGVRRSTPQAEIIAAAHNKKSIIGSDASNDLRYAILPNPAQNFGFVSAVEAKLVDDTQSELERLKLKVIRTQSSSLAILGVAMAHPDFAAGKADVLVVDHGSLVYVPTDLGGGWGLPRLRESVMMRDEESRRMSVEDVTRGTGERGVGLVVIDTGTSLPLRREWLPNAKFEAWGDSIPSQALPIHAALSDNTKPVGLQVLSTVLRGLAHDIGRIPMQSDALLPGWMKTVAVAFWMGVAAIVGFQGYISVRTTLGGKQLVAMEQRIPELNQQIMQANLAIQAIDGRINEAQNLDIWLRENPGVQSLVIEILKPLDTRVQVTQFGISRLEKNLSASHQLRIAFSADARTANTVASGFSTSAGNAGWALRPTNQAVNSGIVTYDALLSVNRSNPSP